MIRVLTANLYNGNTDPSGLGRLLDEVRPDVVASQELDHRCAEVIGGRLPHGMLAPDDDCKGMGLSARHPIEVRRFPLPHRDALVGENGITVWSVHLANPVDRPPPIRQRRAQVRRIEAEVSTSNGPTLLVGDLNASPVWPAYRRLARVLDDGVAEWARGNDQRPARTWGPRPGWPAMLRIDHALVRDLKVHESFVVRVPGSDHRGLVVDVS